MRLQLLAKLRPPMPPVESDLPGFPRFGPNVNHPPGHDTIVRLKQCGYGLASRLATLGVWVGLGFSSLSFAVAAQSDPSIAAEANFFTKPSTSHATRHYFAAGEKQWREGNHELAERFFHAALGQPGPIEEKREVLLALSRLYREANETSKTIAILERFAREFPQDEQLPNSLLTLGDLYRTKGAMDLAVARYFQVLNTTMALSTNDLETYRRLAMQARLRIAETQLEGGKLEEAIRTYDRIHQLDLPKEDQILVSFRRGYLAHFTENHTAAISRIREFLSKHPQSHHVPEALYLLAQSLEKLGRESEAVAMTLELLRSPEPDSLHQAADLDYWRRRTGNELANRLYTQGDFRGALSLYQALARMDTHPEWQLPALYQIALCFEQLGFNIRASEAYEAILKSRKQMGEDARLSRSLELVFEMAAWRLDQLNWEEEQRMRLRHMAVTR